MTQVVQQTNHLISSKIVLKQRISLSLQGCWNILHTIAWYSPSEWSRDEYAKKIDSHGCCSECGKREIIDKMETTLNDVMWKENRTQP